MTAPLTLAQLRQLAEAGSVDTVLACMVDMQGRLIGKRFQVEFFLDSAYEETHGCDYLLADDIDMEPVPGYAAASWKRGYGDFVFKPDLSTMRLVPWLEGTALVLCDHGHRQLARRLAQQAVEAHATASTDQVDGQFVGSFGGKTEQQRAGQVVHGRIGSE